jgi:Ca-activated chloride channel homolog
MTATSPMPIPPPHAAPTSGGRLVSVDGRTLPLTKTTLSVRAAAGLARVVLEQRFENPYDEPLSVRYKVPLPQDGAVSGFAFQLGDRRIVGEVDAKRRARERYEQAIVSGKSAAILDQDRSSLFSQDVGNIPPGESIVAEITIDQPLAWLPEGRWCWRFPTVVAPRYQGAPGRVADSAAQTVEVSDHELAARAALSLRIAEPMPDSGAPASQTHALAVTSRGPDTLVSLRSRAGAPLDRDIAVSWPAAREAIATRLEIARPPAGHPGADDAYALLTVVPPSVAAPRVARDLILLLDTSGSMGGAPLDQARRVASALIDGLDERDSLEMIEFSTQPRRFTPAAQSATDAHKQAAIAWLSSLVARGGTEMHSGILAALEPLRAEAQRQVVLFTDGLIGFEDEIVGTIVNRLPRGCRVHCVGVGSSVNRSLTGPAARAGRGHEAIVSLGDDAERAAARLVAHTAAPTVVDLEVTGAALKEHAPRALPDLMGGKPATLSLRVDPAGGPVVLRGRTPNGTWEQTLMLPSCAHGEGPAAAITCFARERVEDLEAELAAMPTERETIDPSIERLGIDFQIATRMTSWIAVSSEATVDPLAPSRKATMPHELPHGTSVSSFGLRRPASPTMTFASRAMPMMAGAARMPAPAAPPAPGGYGGPPPAAGPPPPPAQASLGAPPEDAAEEEMEATAFEAGDLLEAPAERKRDQAPAPAKAKRRKRAPASRGGGGIGRRLLDGVRSVFGREARLLQGRVVVIGEDTLTIEISLDDALAWAPRKATLSLTDGSTIEVTLVADRTTREGDMTAGQTVRLTLAHAGLATSPQLVHLSLADGDVRIQLTP